MESLSGKTVNPHVYNYTKKEAITGVFLWIQFFGSFHSSIRSGTFCKIVLLKNFWKTSRNTPVTEFFLLKNLHTIKPTTLKGHQHRCFTVNFAKLLKSLCRTPPVSASNFNSTFLTLRPRKTYIYFFPDFQLFKMLRGPWFMN